MINVSETTQMIIKIIMLLAVLVLNSIIFIDRWLVHAVFFSLLILILIVLRAWYLIQFSLLFLLMSLHKFILVGGLNKLPAVGFLIPFIISCLLILPFSKTRIALKWVRAGKIDRTTILLIGGTSAIASLSLIIWATWTNHLGAAEQMMQGFATVPIWQMVLIGIPLFAIFNAFSEEVVYRGVLQNALNNVFTSKTLILLLQSSAFAAIHFSVGFPNDIVGYIMVFGYGIMLGYLRIRSNGMMAPVLTHFFADLTIGYFMLSYVFL